MTEYKSVVLVLRFRDGNDLTKIANNQPKGEKNKSLYVSLTRSISFRPLIHFEMLLLMECMTNLSNLFGISPCRDRMM